MKIQLWTAFHGTNKPNFSIDLGNKQFFYLLNLELLHMTRRLHFKSWIIETSQKAKQIKKEWHLLHNLKHDLFFGDHQLDMSILSRIEIEYTNSHVLLFKLRISGSGCYHIALLFLRYTDEPAT